MKRKPLPSQERARRGVSGRRTELTEAELAATLGGWRGGGIIILDNDGETEVAR